MIKTSILHRVMTIFIRKLFNWIGKYRKKILSTVFIFVFFILLFNFIVIHSTKGQIYSDITEIPPKEYALVLGTSKNGRYGINLYFKYRMEAAAELYFTNKVEKIIVSGDNHIDSYNEPEDMAQYLIGLGVPDSVIIRDYAGFRTLDSIVRAKKVFNASELIIVSQKFHNQRALFIANKYNIDAVAFNARDVNRKFNMPPLREFIAKFVVVMDLFVFQTQPKFLGKPL